MRGGHCKAGWQATQCCSDGLGQSQVHVPPTHGQMTVSYVPKTHSLSLGYHDKNPLHCGTQQQSSDVSYTHLISQSSGGWKSEITPAWLGSDESPLLGRRLSVPFLLYSQEGEGVREGSGIPFIKILMPLMRALHSRPNHLSKAPPPKIITVGIRFSA